MKGFFNLSVKNRLIGIILIVSILSLLLAFLIVSLENAKTFKSEMLSSTSLRAKLIGEYCIGPLSFGLKSDVEEVIEKLKTDQHILLCSIYDMNGKLFASYLKPGETFIPPNIEPDISSLFSSGQLYVKEAITLDDTEYGSIFLLASTSELQKKIRGNLINMLLITVGLIIFSFFLASRLQGIISKPILKLANTTQKISKEGDYSVRVERKGTDEIAALYDGFNMMLEQIKDYSENLEQKVEERTEELNQALLNTAEARDRIDGILKSVGEGLIVTDTRNRIVLMNHASENLLGVSLSNAIGTSLDIVIKDKTLQENVEFTLDKKTTGYQFDFVLPSEESEQSQIMRASTSVLLDKNGDRKGMVMIIHDVSHEREVDRMKTEFLSTAAHELRTPLTSIQGFSELLLTRDDLKEEEKIKFFSYINNQAVGLAKIISDLLDISRIESRRGFSFQKEKSNIDETIQKVIPYFEEQSSIHEFKVDLVHPIEELSIDKEKIEQILKNLISNAVKYSPDGGVIRVSREIIDNDLLLSIEDQGIGMNSGQISKIFDKFFRVDSSDSAAVGTGLGMSIVKYIVEAHGGKIWVESEPGKGTTVKFTIPFEQSGGG